MPNIRDFLPPLPWERPPSRGYIFGGDRIQMASDKIVEANHHIAEAYGKLRDAYRLLEPLAAEPGPPSPVERENWRVIKRTVELLKERAILLDEMTILASTLEDLGRI